MTRILYGKEFAARIKASAEHGAILLREHGVPPPTAVLDYTDLGIVGHEN